MKCDELKDYDIMDIEAIDDERIKASSNGEVVPSTRVYIKADVDKRIDELKDKIQMHDFFWEGCGFDKLGFNNSIQVREEFDKLKAENERLNTRLSESAMKVYKHHNKQTLRALWLARAKRAQERKANKPLFKSYIKSHKSSWFIDGNELELAWDLWEEAFDRVEKICLKKAEEYK